ncbi:MAG TPA: O-antigen ligase family protein [bacterium]|nr:O-antigen ligase family protein [bacterium]
MIGAILIFIAFAVMARYCLNLSLGALLAISPAYLIRFKIGGILPSTWLEMAFFGLLFGWLISLIADKNFRADFWQRLTYFSRQNKALLILLVIIFVSSISACLVPTDKIAALGLARAYLWEPLIYFGLMILYWTKKDLPAAIAFLVPTMLLIDILALNQAINGYSFMEMAAGTSVNWRATGPYPYPNAIGLFLAPATLLLWLIGWRAILSKKYIIFSGIVLLSLFNLWTIYMAQTEAAIVAIIGAVGLFIITRKKGIYLGIIGAVLAIGIFSYAQVWPKIMEKLTFNDFSGQIRRQMLLETGSMIKDNFLWGAGLGAYQTAVAPYHWPVLIFTDAAGKLYEQPVEIYMYPHNIFLNFWSELGFFGMLAFMSLIFLSLWKSVAAWWRDKNDEAWLAGLALLVLLVHGLADVPLFKNDLALLFFFIIAVNHLLHSKPNPATKV